MRGDCKDVLLSVCCQQMKHLAIVHIGQQKTTERHRQGEGEGGGGQG